MTLFGQLLDGAQAERNIEVQVADILGVEDILGISFDHYDDSLEFYMLPDQEGGQVTEEQHLKIMEFGCVKYWLNYKDGTQRYMTGERVSRYGPGVIAAWEAFNRG